MKLLFSSIMDKLIKLKEALIFSELSDSALKKMAEIIEINAYQKNDLLDKINIPSFYEYTLLNGIVRSYVIDPNGQDVTLAFFTED